MYKCKVCHTLNSPMRLHCQVCNAMPTMYRIPGRTEVVAAVGCKRIEVVK